MAPRTPFPSDPGEFDQDTRISYSKESQTFVLEDENMEEWEWLPGPSKWSKTMDSELMKQQAEIYKIAGVDEDTPALNPAQKRKEAQLEDPATNPKNASKAKSATTAIATATVPRQNTAVFVTGLPHDVDSDEVRTAFAKFGVIAESVDNDEKRIKLYNDKDGNFKGEALIIYHRPESVSNAIYMLDGASFPRADYDDPTSIITVVAADTSYKARKDDTVAEDRPAARAKGTKDRAKAKKKAEEMNRRLADWSDDEPSAIQQTSSRWDKVVVIKKVFTLQELEDVKEEEEKRVYIADIMDDVRQQAELFGTIKNITAFDKEEDGVVTIRFSDAMAAKACVDDFHGRNYDCRQLEAYIATGEEKFKKTRKLHIEDDNEAKRLEDYSNFIEGQNESENGAGGVDQS